MGRVSIKDIARRAGVCIGTVSRVVNNLDRVHPQTRARIEAIIRETGYRPSSSGRALVSGKTRNILVVLHNIADPYCAALSREFSREWHARGYQMLLGDSNFDPALEREHVLKARDGGIDGLIVSPCPPLRTNTAIYRQMVRERFPFIAIDNRLGGVKTNCVKYNDVKAATMAVEHLAGRGHREIAFLFARPEFQTIRDRTRGFTLALQRLGLPRREEFLALLPGSPLEASAAILRLMRHKRRPTAILAENEIMALICMNTVLQDGIRVPDDLAIIAVGDTLSPSFLPIPLTTINLRHDHLCRIAVERLSHQMESPSPDRSPRVETVEPDLVLRAST